MNKSLALFLKGVFMGIAEIIPGVSGGTIAFITGIYEELIASIKSINSKTLKLFLKLEFRKLWIQINGRFLLILFLGMFLSIILLSRLIVYLLDYHPFKIWGLFFGLIVSSAILIFQKIKNNNIINFIFLMTGLMVSTFIALSAPSTTSNSSFFIFLSGSIAISAMILPGISGSFILVFLSKYEFILNALNSLDFNVIFVFLLGCVFGLITFSRLLSYLFRRFSDYMISTLVGFLFGSLFKIWPFFRVLEYSIDNEPVYTLPVFPNSSQSFEIIMFLFFSFLGFFSMWLLEKKFNTLSNSD